MPSSHSRLNGDSDGCSPKNPSRSIADCAEPATGRGMAIDRTHRVVRALAVRHDDVQRVRRAALKEHDQHLAARVAVQRRAFEQVLREHRLSQEARIEAQRRQRHRAGLHEDSAIHSQEDIHLNALIVWNSSVRSTPLKLRRPQRQSDHLRQPLQIHLPAEPG